jgi:hypothetical protein
MYHVPVLFGVELGRESGGIDQITEHDGQLPSFRVGRRCSRTGFSQRGGLFLGGKRLCCLRHLRSDCLYVTDPDENSVILVDGKSFYLNQVDFQVFDVLIINIEATLEGAVGDALLPLKQLDNLSDQCIILHGRFSAGLATAMSSR